MSFVFADVIAVYDWDWLYFLNQLTVTDQSQKCTQFATLVKWLQNKILCSLDKFQVFRLLQETSVARSQQGECCYGCARAWIEAASGRVIY